MTAKGLSVMDIGRVFSTSFAMFRQRFWLLLGMWLVFLVIQIAVATVLFISIMAMGMAGAAGVGAGLDDPAAIASLGVGMILLAVLFYASYVVILMAQQAAMVTIASPLEEPAFGTAMVRGFRSALPFFAVVVVLLLGYIALAALVGVIELAAGGGGSSEVLSAVLALLFLPVMVYLSCRFAVLIPVVAVDQVFNPFTALRRSWSVTRGKVLAILLALIGFILLSLVALGLPFALLFGAAFTGQDSPSTGVVMMIVGFLIFVPLLIGYTMFASAFTASLHCEVTGGGADRLEEVFA